MPNFYTPQEIAEETGFSRQAVCFWLRELFPANGYEHESKYWWRLEEEEKSFLLAQIRSAEITHPGRPLYALRKTFVFDFG